MPTHVGHHGAGPAGPVHPYLDWAIQTRFSYLRPGPWLPLLVEFDPDALPRTRGTTPLEVFTDLGWLVATFKAAVIVPELFTHPPEVIRNSRKFNFCVVLVDRDQAAALIADPSWRNTILRADLGPPVSGPGMLPAALPALISSTSPIPQSAGPAAMTDRVVMAVIDNGIAFAHERFGTAAGTRIAYLWRQEFGGPMGSGTELTAAAIDAAVEAARQAGGDEDLVYRATGSLDFTVDGYKALARRRSHGTHVLDLAAGHDPDQAVANRPIIAVDMPEEAIGDPAGSTLTAHAVLALLYIMNRAESLRAAGEILPVVINLSYGPQDGPHDGRSLFEVVADLFTALYKNSDTPLRIVLAAGNSRQARMHASFSIAPTGKKTLPWRIQPGGLSASFMEIWLPRSAGAQIAVNLRSPSGQTVFVDPGQLEDWWPASNRIEMGAKYVPAGNGFPRTSVVLTVARTAFDPSLAADQPVAPSGLWQVEITQIPDPKGPAQAISLDAWIKRADTPGGRRAKGRQSYFDAADYQRFRNQAPTPTRLLEFDPLSPGDVTRRGTLSGIATGKTTVVVGGFRRGADWNPERHPAPYSAEGPHSNPVRAMKSPTCLFPGDDSIACRGVLAAGTRSGSIVAMTGTSVAAPQASRWIADQWTLNRFPPKPPFRGLVPPIRNRFNPIPPADLPLVVSDGLMPPPARRGRP